MKRRQLKRYVTRIADDLEIDYAGSIRYIGQNDAVYATGELEKYILEQAFSESYDLGALAAKEE